MDKIIYYSYLTNTARPKSITFIFIPYNENVLSIGNIRESLREYFTNNIFPDEIAVQCSDLNYQFIHSVFTTIENLEYIPLFNSKLKISIYSLIKSGKLVLKVGKGIANLSSVTNRILSYYFTSNGGLINSSNSAHHFEFPSGKHATQFLRTGNILINGTLILYLAHSIFSKLKNHEFDYIYSDTSSINSIGLALSSLLLELGVKESSLLIESFGSYSAFEDNKLDAPSNTLFLISSSTSGSILDRLKESTGRAYDFENVLILFGLGVKSMYSRNVICKLDYDEFINPQGLQPIKSFSKNEDCKFCLDDSQPLKVTGDVFLLEKPMVDLVDINVTDSPKSISKFSDFFQSKNSDPLVKTFYKENSESKRYESFVNIDDILKEWQNKNEEDHPFAAIFKKLEDYIILHIPSSIKYLVVLDDSQSRNLAFLIQSCLKDHGIDLENNRILSISEIKTIDENDAGSIAIVSSSIVSGRNLLFASKELREFEKSYRRFYFVFIHRYFDSAHKRFLEHNLGYGDYGLKTNPMINVYEIQCSRDSENTAWHRELAFLKSLQEFIEENDLSEIVQSQCYKRENFLNESGSTNGISSSLFLPSQTGKELQLNKGFAFAPKESFSEENASQSEIYFIVSSVLTNMRIKKRLRQSDYVKSLISPGNFIRYNDGVIQAAILRSATYDELRYDFDEESSYLFYNVIKDMLKHKVATYAEALDEFLYAIAIKKLRMTTYYLHQLIIHLEKSLVSLSPDTLTFVFIKYIKEAYKIDVVIDNNLLKKS